MISKKSNLAVIIIIIFIFLPGTEHLGTGASFAILITTASG